MSDTRPTRQQADLAEMLELLLDKGVVINADIAVTVGETELLGVQLRAAVASFETAATYGMEFPQGTDMDRVEQVAGVDPIDDGPGDQAELSELDIEATQSEEADDTETGAGSNAETDADAEETATTPADGDEGES